MKQFYITYRNLGKPEKTPILGNTEEWVKPALDFSKPVEPR